MFLCCKAQNNELELHEGLFLRCSPLPLFPNPVLLSRTFSPKQPCWYSTQEKSSYNCDYATFIQFCCFLFCSSFLLQSNSQLSSLQWNKTKRFSFIYLFNGILASYGLFNVEIWNIFKGLITILIIFLMFDCIYLACQ